MPYKTVKLKKYKHKKSTWITLGLLKTTRPESPKYFAIWINLTTYNTILKKTYVLLNAYIMNHVLTNSKMTLKNMGKINGILSRTYKKKTFPNSFIYNENIIADKTAIANTFNSYFTNIGPNLANQIQNSTNKTFRYYLIGNHNNLFNFQRINEETISKTIDVMHTKVSCRFDGISSWLLKSNKPVLKKNLTNHKPNINYGYLPQQTQNSQSNTNL